MSRALDFFLSPAPEPPTPPARVPRKQRTRAHTRATAAPPAAAPPLATAAPPAAAAPLAALTSHAPRVTSLRAPAAAGAISSSGAGVGVLLPGDPLAARDFMAAAPGRVVTGAAVVGRPREAEPVAAALALALRRETRSKAATVAVIGPPLPEGSGGSGAGRRLAARLEAEGLEPRVRGRLAWVRLDPADPELPALAWQLALVAAPVVLAVTAPRTAAIDAALADQDLVVLVTSDPDGPLAVAATAGLPRVATAAPLRRGLARELARAGIRPPAAIRRLVEPGRAGR